MIELTKVMKRRREEAKSKSKLLHSDTLFYEFVIKNSARPPVINASFSFINSVLSTLRNPDFYASIIASKIVERVI